MLELSAYDIPAEPQRMDIRHPVTGLPLQDDEGNVAAIFLVGSDSKEFRDQRRKNQDQRLKDAKLRLTQEDLEEESMASLVACTARWEHLAVDGKSEFSPAAARELYRRFPWIKEQAMAFVLGRENFIRAS